MVLSKNEYYKIKGFAANGNLLKESDFATQRDSVFAYINFCSTHYSALVLELIALGPSKIKTCRKGA